MIINKDLKRSVTPCKVNIHEKQCETAIRATKLKLDQTNIIQKERKHTNIIKRVMSPEQMQEHKEELAQQRMEKQMQSLKNKEKLEE